MKKVLVANRGEIALRISRAVQEIGMQAVAVFPADDAQSLHVSGPMWLWNFQAAVLQPT